MSRLSEPQVNFFRTFGFLGLPGLLKADLPWILEEFEAVHHGTGQGHDPSKRTCVAGFLDRSKKLSGLLEHPAIAGILHALLGEDFNYHGSDGNYYSGDTGWHADCADEQIHGRYLKIAFYLDPLDGQSGALRVVPGSHRVGEPYAQAVRHALRTRGSLPCAPRDLPCQVLATQPGDVLVFDHHTLHASFNGGNRRRMFTLNAGTRAQTPQQFEEIRRIVHGAARFWAERCYGDALLNTATPERRKHLEQQLAFEPELPALVEEAKRRMPEPARG